MSLKISLKHLRADLESAREMFTASRDAGDYVGFIQYKARVKELEELLAKESTDKANLASVAVYFDGGPVVGSHGIAAAFGGKMLGFFQDLVSEDIAVSTIGELGERGTIPASNTNQLLITGVALGSFGFTLEEANNQDEWVETNLSASVKRTVGKLQSVASEEESDFIKSLEQMDHRELVTLQKFFSTLEKEKATIRLVDDEKEVSLDEPSIHRGRERVDRTQIDETDENIHCKILGILPEHRKFEAVVGDGTVIMGSVSEKAIETYNALILANAIHLPQKWIARFFIRKITPINRPERYLYKLTDLVAPDSVP